ncbi:MAG: HepT-like ribonuclease domain-containing protein [Cyanobacteria bacterium J06623_1]
MKDPKIFIIHIRECIHRIEAYTEEGKAAFFEDLRTQDAVVRNLETLADATQRLPTEWKSKYSHINWRKVADFRNFLAHQYLDISLEIIWNVIQEQIPELKDCINSMAEEFWNEYE